MKNVSRSMIVGAMLVFAWTSVAYAQEKNSSGMSINDRIEQSYREIRAQREDIKTFVVDYVVRKTTIRMVQNLQKKGFDNHQISLVIEGESYQNLIQKIRSYAPLQKNIDQFINQILEPGYLEEQVRERRVELAESIQQDMAQARASMKKSPLFRQTETIVREERQP
ncbi:MAG: hypothetical protein R3A11_05570 [Bdellovibrionota bacterium]